MQAKADKSIPYDGVRKLLANTHRLNDDLRDIVRLLACTGARLNEIAGLEARDFDPEAGTINIRWNQTPRLKNSASVRLVPVIDKEVLLALAGRVSKSNPASPCLPGMPVMAGLTPRLPLSRSGWVALASGPSTGSGTR